MESIRRLAECTVILRCDDERIARMLLPWLDLFREEPAGGVDAAGSSATGIDAAGSSAGGRPFQMTFTAVPDAALRPVPPGARPLVDYFYVSGTVEEARLVFRGTDGSWLRVDPAARRAEAELPRSALDGPPWVARDLFNAALTTFLRTDGRFPLHAAALEHDGRGLLVVGPPMAGKTTLSLNFIRRGWAWVADDKVLLRADDPRGVLAAGLFRQSNIDPALADYFPELAELRALPPAHPHSPKRAVVLNRYYGLPDRTACLPEWLLFPQVLDVGPTRCEPLGAQEAFLELLRQSPVVNETRVTGAHLACLSRLAGESRAFRLLMGRDLLEDPGRLAKLGSEMDMPVGPPMDLRVRPLPAGPAPAPSDGG